MKRFKKLTVALVIIAILLIAPSARAIIGIGDTVFDTANLQQQIINGLQEMVQMVEQINQMKQQYEQMQASYNAMTGARGLGDILNNPALKSYLPEDWRNVYDSIKSGGYAGLTGSAKNIRDANRAFEICASIKDTNQKLACEREVAKAVQDKAFQMEAYDKTKDRLKQIDDLMKKMSSTTDQKEALEVLGRLSAEQAMIQNEMTRMQLYKMLADSEEKLITQQQKELGIKEMKKHGGVKMQPLSLGK